MTESSYNPFADAVRQVAGRARAVAAGTLKAGAACATALVIMAGASATYHGLVLDRTSGIPGAAAVVQLASQNASMARVQAQMSEYYACGLLTVTKTDLERFGAGARMDGIRKASADVIAAAPASRPETGALRAVGNVAEMAKGLAMMGLSRVVDAAVSSPESKAWASRMQADLDVLPARLAEQSRLAGVARDAASLQDAEREVADSMSSIGCRI